MPQITSSDGVRLHYLESGDPAGRPVVLIAGFKAPATSWKPQLAALEKAGHRVIAFDRRGHGASEIGPDGSHTMLRHGADIGDALRELDLTDATLVGQSMGGNSIWALLSAGGGAGIRDIVIVDQTPRMLNSDDWAYGFYDYDSSNADTLFATGIPDPGRHTIGAKGPVRITRLLKAMDLKAAKAGFTPAELRDPGRPRQGRLAPRHRRGVGAGAVHRRTRERVLAVRARGGLGIPRPKGHVRRHREGGPRDEHRAAEGVRRAARTLPRGLSALRTPCRG